MDEKIHCVFLDFNVYLNANRASSGHRAAGRERGRIQIGTQRRTGYICRTEKQSGYL